jgi:cytochrome P450
MFCGTIKMIEDRFTDPATLECPFSYLAMLRDRAPVYRSENLRSYFVTRYSDVQYILNNPEIFSSSPGDSIDFMANFSPRFDPIYQSAGVPPQTPTLVTTDGTQHARYRNHIDRTFGARSVRDMEPKIDQLIDELIDTFIDENAVDLYERFCLLLPLYVICDLIGLPRSDAKFLRSVADGSVRLATGGAETEDSRNKLHQLQVEFHLYLNDHIARVRAHPDDTLLSNIVHTETSDGTFLSDAEVMSLVSTLNVGGNETTTNGLANMFLLCFRQPDLQETLRNDRTLVPKFVEEAMRLETAVATMPRWCRQDVELSGMSIPAGSVIQVSFCAANRDPNKFTDPDEVDLTRKGSRNHMAFGMGVHYCLGAMLARMELQAAMNRFLDRMANVSIAGAIPKHRPKLLGRVLSELPIVFEKIT